MNILFKYISFLLALLLSFSAFSQNIFNLPDAKSSKIRFQLINNIIIIPVELNGTPLSFVLDTGVNKPILFNLANMDSLQINNRERSFLRGLGSNGNVQAIKSKRNIIKVGDAVAVNSEVSVVFDEDINFTSRLGIPVHGIIGYDIFKDFVVEINYKSKYIRLFQQQFFKLKKPSKWQNLPLEIISNKPYINAEVILNKNLIPVKLLIDTGSSDALWLFKTSNDDIVIPERNFDDFLGKGLSGPVYGKRSKLEAFKLGPHSLETVNVAFPDSESISIAQNFKARNGSLSGNILRRFNIFFDYNNQQIWLKKNSNFKLPFHYNNSGITLEQRGFRVVKKLDRNNDFDGYGSQDRDGSKVISVVDTYKFELSPSFQIVELRANSNAAKAGVKVGDIVLTVNKKETSELKLQDVNKFFFDDEGKVLRLVIDRDGKLMSFKFKLDDVFKKKSLQTEGSK